MESEAYKAKRDAERKADRAKPHPLKVGDILYSSWGYDQTNIDFYQVTRVVGAHTVELRKIAGKDAGGGNGYDRGNCVASPGQFIGEPFQKRANHEGTIAIASYANAYLWDGKPRYWSSYA